MHLHPAVAIYLGQTLLSASSNQPGRRAGSSISSLFGLAPNVVSLAGLLPDRRWALNSPFHPYRHFKCRRFHFCCTFS